jgi:hypothetical protein
MRLEPLIGQKAWFGPRRFGWGLSPVSVEGWTATAASIAAIVILVTVAHKARWSALIVVAALLLLTFLKGTSPGGPSQWKEFNAKRGNGDRS